MPCISAPLLECACEVGVAEPEVDSPDGDLAGLSAMVDCEEEREKVFASGARCVSLSSTLCQPYLDRHFIGQWKVY